MKALDYEEFNTYIKDIVLNEKFNLLKDENHHGISRYEHSMRVAKYTYKITKFFNSKRVQDVTRAALLHDFYLNSDLGDASSSKRLGLHPQAALDNSLKYYELSDIQKDIIVNHMFPITKKLPKYKESWLVTLVDKNVSTYEMLKFKLPLYAGIYLLFFMNVMAIKN